MQPNLSVEFNLYHPIIIVPVDPCSDCARFYPDGKSALVEACTPGYNGTSKVVVAQVPYSSNYYICIGTDVDPHTYILNEGLKSAVGANWRKDLINFGGAEFKVNITRPTVKIFGSSSTIGAGIPEAIQPKVERAIEDLVIEYLKGRNG